MFAAYPYFFCIDVTYKLLEFAFMSIFHLWKMEMGKVK